MEPKGFDEQWPEKGYILTYTRPEPIEFACYPGCKGNTTFAMRGSHVSEFFEIHVRQHVEIRLEYDQKKSYVDILKDIFTFVRLVTFATYEQSYPTAIEFGDPELTDEYLKQRLNKTIPKTVTCYYQNGFYKPSFQCRYWQHHMLTFDSLNGKFADLVPLWFEQADVLARPIELLLQFLSDKYDFSNDRFIEIAKALEAFHRLQYGTDIKYRQRLQDIVRDYSFPYFDKRVPDKAIFCQNTVKSRNYYTHFNELDRAAALKGKELFDLTESWKLLLLAAILRNLKIPITAVEESAQRVIY